MPKGHYSNEEKRATGNRHPNWKHGKFVQESRSPEAREKGRLRSRAWSETNKDRRRSQQRKYRESHREQIRERSREYMGRPEVRARCNAARNTPEGKAKRKLEHQRARKKNPELHRWSWLKAKYGLMKHDYEAMLQEQNGRCKICDALPTGLGVGKILEVDHCHKTNRVRGLICRRCNTAIAYLESEPSLLAKMVSYLQVNHIRVEVA